MDTEQPPPRRPQFRSSSVLNGRGPPRAAPGRATEHFCSSCLDSPQAHVLSPSGDQAWPSSLRARQGRGRSRYIQQWALGSLSLQVTQGLLDRRGTKEKWALPELQVRVLGVAGAEVLSHRPGGGKQGDGRAGVRHPSAPGLGPRVRLPEDSWHGDRDGEGPLGAGGAAVTCGEVQGSHLRRRGRACCTGPSARAAGGRGTCSRELTGGRRQERRGEGAEPAGRAPEGPRRAERSHSSRGPSAGGTKPRVCAREVGPPRSRNGARSKTFAT